MSNPGYRKLWQARVGRVRNKLNQAAVAKVIEQHLWESGERSDGETSLARDLKDRVSRALTGVAISRETLTWIADAFRMSPDDTGRLLDAYMGVAETCSRGVAFTLRRRREMIRRQCHRTVSLFERYRIDEHGYPELRHTHHTIRAIEQGVDIYIFNHEPEATRVEVLHGGEVGRQHHYGGGLCSVEIILNRPLLACESTTLEYKTYFGSGATRLTEVRRAAFARSENVDLAVEFTGKKLPRNAWWCAWDDQIGGSLVLQEVVNIEQRRIQRSIPYIEETVVGFKWEPI